MMEDKPNVHINTIPITVDAVKSHNEYHLTRCTYFSIEHKNPGSPSVLRLYQDIMIPFFMIDLSGVITAPLGGKKQYFDNASDYDNLFRLIDNHPDYYVDTNDLWIPTSLLDNSAPTVRRGMIYRIDENIFRTVYALRETLTSDEELHSFLDVFDAHGVVEYSGVETEALMAWQNKLINAMKESYHANPQSKLPKKDVPPPPRPTTPVLGN